jgi:ABC-type nickel/cobalt efflux system permease component RcnA
MLISAASASAHPLGNFTINHYAGIVVSPDEIRLDVVLDQAEIPTFQERQRIDTNQDGTISDAENEAERQVQCRQRLPALQLTIAGQPATLEVIAAGLSFPPGAGGLSTMRVVCEFRSTLAGPMVTGTTIGYQDTSFAERIGWREVVVQGDRMTVETAGLTTTSISARLTSYPKDLLAVPLDVSSVTFQVAAGGPALTSSPVPDAFPLDAPAPSGGAPTAVGVGQTTTATAAVPGGVGGEIAGLLKTQDLTPPIIILSLVTAMVLGAGHAITPGHGKTIMAAYLVGTRGTARHALALGMTVTISHTLGVLGLAGVILAIGSVAPDQFSRSLSVVSGLLVIGIGLYLVIGRLREQRRSRAQASLAAYGGYASRLADGAAHADHHHTQEDEREPDAETSGQSAPGERATSAATLHVHDHGSGPHEHLPPPNTPLTWRSLFVLGLFGGLVPSINALIILLATLATGRAAYGLVLVVAFGIGMAIVLGGIGLGLVYAARMMARTPSGSVFSRVVAWAPLATALVILVLGIYLTRQAIVGTPVL